MNADTKPGSRARVRTPARLRNFSVSDFIALRSPSDRASGAARSRSWSRSGEGEQIVGDDTQAHPPLHPTRTSIPTSPQPMTTFERADASFTACAPAQRRSSGARAFFTRLAWQHDVSDTTVARRALVVARGKAAVGDGQVRSVVEEGDVTIQGGLPESAVRLAALTHLIVGDDLHLRLLDLHAPPELGRLGQLALADDLGVRLEETDHLAGEMRIASEHSGPRLRHDPLDQLDRDRKLDGQRLTPRPCRRGFGLANYRSRDPHQALIEELHARFALLANRRGGPVSRSATTLRDLEHAARDTARALPHTLAEPHSVVA